jgi:putative DNA primase/helicase
LERLAGFMRSMPLALDELQSKTGYKRNFEGIIYMLGQGQGRTRGRKAGGIEIIPTWRNCIISTGEQPLTDDHSGGGAKNRVIDVYCKDAIFHDAPAIAGAVQENYGWVGKEYIEGLMQQGVKPRAEQLYDSFYSNISADNVSTEKQAMETAMLVLGEYFSDIFVFHMQKEDASQAAQEFANGIKQFITDSADVDDIARIYDWIIGGIASNQPKFTLSSPDYNEIWGEKEDDGSYWIISTKLSEALENTGFSYRKALAGLAEREKIEVFQCKDGKTEYTRCKRIGNANPRMVHLFTNGEGWEEVSGGDIPNEFL